MGNNSADRERGGGERWMSFNRSVFILKVSLIISTCLSSSEKIKARMHFSYGGTHTHCKCEINITSEDILQIEPESCFLVSIRSHWTSIINYTDSNTCYRRRKGKRQQHEKTTTGSACEDIHRVLLFFFTSKWQLVKDFSTKREQRETNRDSAAQSPPCADLRNKVSR